MWETVWPYAAALIPFLFMAFAFSVIMKSIVTSDRNERNAQRRWAEEHSGAPASSPDDDATS